MFPVHVWLAKKAPFQQCHMQTFHHLPGKLYLVLKASEVSELKEEPVHISFTNQPPAAPENLLGMRFLRILKPTGFLCQKILLQNPTPSCLVCLQNELAKRHSLLGLSQHLEAIVTRPSMWELESSKLWTEWTCPGDPVPDTTVSWGEIKGDPQGNAGARKGWCRYTHPHHVKGPDFSLCSEGEMKVHADQYVHFCAGG